MPKVEPALAPARTSVSPPVAPSTVISREKAVAGLGQAFSQRVRFAGRAAPFWAFLLPLLGLTAVGAAWLSMAMHQPARTPVAEASLPSPAEASAPAAGSSQHTPQPSALDLADLEAKAPFTLNTDEVLTVAAAASKRDLEAAQRFRGKLKDNPAVIQDKAVLAELRTMVADPDSAREALAGVAELPGPVAADLLYELWTGTTSRTDTTELARALVYGTDVRSQASAAVKVALDLRIAETCDQNRELLARAAKHGDRRSLHLLGKLKQKKGCGKNKAEDCFACLRDGTQLDDAMKAVKQRRPPAFAGL